MAQIDNKQLRGYCERKQVVRPSSTRYPDHWRFDAEDADDIAVIITNTDGPVNLIIHDGETEDGKSTPCVELVDAKRGRSLAIFQLSHPCPPLCQ